jgi:hypothetical protein
MPVRVDSSFFFSVTRARRIAMMKRDATKDASKCSQTYIQQMFLREILSFYKSFCAALSSSSALAVVGSNSGENLKGG